MVLAVESGVTFFFIEVAAFVSLVLVVESGVTFFFIEVAAFVSLVLVVESGVILFLEFDVAGLSSPRTGVSCPHNDSALRIAATVIMIRS